MKKRKKFRVLEPRLKPLSESGLGADDPIDFDEEFTLIEGWYDQETGEKVSDGVPVWPF